MIWLINTELQLHMPYLLVTIKMSLSRRRTSCSTAENLSHQHIPQLKGPQSGRKAIKARPAWSPNLYPATT